MAYQKGEDVEMVIPERMNVASILIDEKAGGALADKKVIRFVGDPPASMPLDMTLGELRDLVNKTGNALKSLGLEVEDRVVIIVPDSPEFIAIFLGAIKMGAVPVPVNTMLGAQQYQYMLNNSRARAVIVDDGIAPLIEEIRGELDYLKHVIVIGETKKGQISYHDIVNAASAQLEAVEMSKDDVAFWLYSSGTTGAPKGVVHLQHDMLYSADTYFKRALKITEDDTIFSVSKLFFAYGLGNSLYSPLRLGTTIVLYPGTPEEEKLFEIIEKYRVTVFYAVPRVYARMVAIEGVEKKYDLSSLRFCVSGGEALPPAIYEQWREKFGLELLDCIGTTEICHCFISNPPGLSKAGTSGIAVPGYELKTVDDDGNDTPVGDAGRLFVKGDSIAAYYWNQHDKSKETFVGEWINTSDLYIQDEEGYWAHAGRHDDMMRNRGLWVSPVEVENAVAAYPAVLEVAVAQGFTHDRLETIKAFVILKEGHEPSPQLEKELHSFLRSNRLSGYKIPDSFEFVDELPKTATGKVQRYVLRHLERERMEANQK
ncbi:benzoate-CoA ligase family protein [Chloroflexota bacterium]